LYRVLLSEPAVNLMSMHLLKLIPADPWLVPPKACWSAAAARFQHFAPQAETIEASSSATIQFIDPGGNFERVLCPACASDITDWWTTAMDAAWQSSFADLSISLPCCGITTNLNDLQYEWPAGFARFTLAAQNPKLERGLSFEELDELQAILGCRLRQVFVRI
jgi:hypothetical protein